ncbi:MAG: S-layer homology domain-containing protein [Geitlerinemataceae cyanobacterium]
MPIDRPFQIVPISLICLVSSLAACANSPFGTSLEKSLSADPQLSQPTPQPTETPSPKPQDEEETQTELPADFPTQIPRYETATLKKVVLSEEKTGAYPVVTKWTSPDPSNAIEMFYQTQLAQNGWKLSNSTPDGDTTTMLADRENLQVEVTIEPSTDTGETSLTIAYRDESTTALASPDSSANSTPVPTPADTPTSFSDLEDTAEPVRAYIQDLAQLGVLTPSTPQSNTFAPNQPLKRREYARWLLSAHNQIYADTPSKQIRPATTSNTPSFGDIPATDPDFDIIQGLAEAGIIPSALSGSATTVKFRPDDPISREDTIAWKVPLDWRQALPAATLQSISETWGFQDTAQIDPKVLKALLADFQSGEQANIRRAFGYTTIFQPKKPMTRAEAAATLWYFGNANTGRSAKEALEPTPSQE